MIVGTHLDDEVAKLKFQENVAKLKRKYDWTLSNLSPERVDAFASIARDGYHAVSCKTREGVKELVNTIIRLATEQPHMGEEIPNNYLALEKAILTLKPKKNEVPSLPLPPPPQIPLKLFLGILIIINSQGACDVVGEYEGDVQRACRDAG